MEFETYKEAVDHINEVLSYFDTKMIDIFEIDAHIDMLDVDLNIYIGIVGGDMLFTIDNKGRTDIYYVAHGSIPIFFNYKHIIEAIYLYTPLTSLANNMAAIFMKQNSDKYGKYPIHGTMHKRVAKGMKNIIKNILLHEFIAKYGEQLKTNYATLVKNDNRYKKFIFLPKGTPARSLMFNILASRVPDVFLNLPQKAYLIIYQYGYNVLSSTYYDIVYQADEIVEFFFKLIKTRFYKYFIKYGSASDYLRYYVTLHNFIRDITVYDQIAIYSRYEMVFLSSLLLRIGHYTPTHMIAKHFLKLLSDGCIREKNIRKALREASRLKKYKLAHSRMAIHHFLELLFTTWQELHEYRWSDERRFKEASKLLGSVFYTTNLTDIVKKIRGAMILQKQDTKAVFDESGAYKLSDIKMMPLIEELNIEGVQHLKTAADLRHYGDKYDHCLDTHIYNYNNPTWYLKYKNAIAHVSYSGDKLMLIQCYGPRNTRNNNAKYLEALINKKLRKHPRPNLSSLLSRLSDEQTRKYGHMYETIYKLSRVEKYGAGELVIFDALPLDEEPYKLSYYYMIKDIEYLKDK